MSNLFANRANSEHPIDLWSFDDHSHYLSLLSEEERDLANGSVWPTPTNCVVSQASGVSGTPIPESETFMVVPVDEENEYTVLSVDVFDAGDLHESVPVAVSAFVRIGNYSIEYVEIGSLSNLTKNYISPTTNNEWVKVSGEALVADGDVVINFMPLAGETIDSLTVYVNGLTLGQYAEPYSSESLGAQVITPPASLTADNPDGTDTLPTDASVNVVLCESYVNKTEAYHVVKDNRLMSYNAGIPLAYGSRHAVRLRSFADGPSFVFDGRGFLTELGRHDIYTVEFWIRVSGSTTQSRKIFGPTQSPDGLYLNGSILTLSIGGNHASGNVGTLYEPTLVDITYGNSVSEVFINGEKLISLAVNESTVSLAKVRSATPAPTNEYNQKWLGFWSFPELEPVFIDCISIYAYRFNEVLAKRHFVWGQGVADTGYTNSQYGGKTVYADFSTANAAHNVSYPDNAFWSNGMNKNLSATQRKLEVPSYPLPEFVFSSKTLEELYESLYAIDANYFSFRPDVGWSSETSFIRFGSLGDYGTSLGGISFRWSTPITTLPPEDMETYTEFDTEYIGLTMDELESLLSGTFATYDDLIAGTPGAEPLVMIRSKSRPSRFIYVYTNTDKLYVAYLDGLDITMIFEEEISVDTEYVTYLNFASTMASATGLSIPQGMRNLLSNKSDLEILVGGDGVKTFGGEIYNFSFLDNYYNGVVKGKQECTYTWVGDQITVTSPHSHGLSVGDYVDVTFIDGGLASTVARTVAVESVVSITEFTVFQEGSGTAGDLTYDSTMFVMNISNSSHQAQFDICSYTLLPKICFDRFYADVGIRGVWTDYVPLQKLAGVAYDQYGNPGSALDVVQFNTGYPVSREHLSESVGSWTYSELEEYYSGMPLYYLYYEYLGGFITYGNLASKTSGYDALSIITTEESFVRSYVSFQDNISAITDFYDFDKAYPMSTNSVVHVDSIPEPFDSLIEVVDGTAILPPHSRRIEDVVMAVYVEFVVPGTSTYPVALRSLELASFAMKRDGFTEVGGKYGKGVYPFVNNGLFYDFNAVNAFKINKRGFPLLYQGKESGFTPLSNSVGTVNRGMLIDMSQDDGSSFEMDSMQLWVKRSEPFPNNKVKVFDISYATTRHGLVGNKKYTFTIEQVPNDTSRAVVKVYNENGVQVEDSGELSFYQNGNLVRYITLGEEEWTAIGIGFNTSENRAVSSRVLMNLYSGLTYNNISAFRALEPLGMSVSYRPWLDVDDEAWSFWDDLTWSEVLSAAAAKISTTRAAQNIYDVYVGKRTIAINSAADVRLEQDAIRHYADNSWLSQVLIPT